MAMENPHGWTDGWLHSDPYPVPEMSRSPINTKRMRPAIVLRNRPIAIGSNGSKMCHAPMFWYILVFLWCSMGNVRVNMGNSTGEMLVNEHNRKLLSRDFQPVQPSIISSSPQAKLKVWGFQDSMLGKTPGIPWVGISLHAMPFINPGKVPLVKSTTAVHLCLSSSLPMALAQSWRIPPGFLGCVCVCLILRGRNPHLSFVLP